MTEWLLPGMLCAGCGTVTFADPPPGLHPGAVSYEPMLDAAAVMLSCYGNVPPQVMGILATQTVASPSAVSSNCNARSAASP